MHQTQILCMSFFSDFINNSMSNMHIFHESFNDKCMFFDSDSYKLKKTWTYIRTISLLRHWMHLRVSVRRFRNISRSLGIEKKPNEWNLELIRFVFCLLFYLIRNSAESEWRKKKLMIKTVLKQYDEQMAWTSLQLS